MNDGEEGGREGEETGLKGGMGGRGEASVKTTQSPKYEDRINHISGQKREKTFASVLGSTIGSDIRLPFRYAGRNLIPDGHSSSFLVETPPNPMRVYTRIEVLELADDR